MRLYPTTPPPNGQTTTTLSILDHPAARFGLTHAIFIYQTSALNTDSASSAFTEKLIESLRRTLVDYPHFCGQLGWAKVKEGKGGRCRVRFGGGKEEGEPGVAWEIERLGEGVGKFIPTTRAGSVEDVRVVQESVKELSPKDTVALWDLKSTHDENGQGLPGLRIKLSMLENGYAVAVKMAHVLGDASTLTSFVTRWAAYTTESQHSSAPLFDPSLVDRCADQLEDYTRTAEERLAHAKKLPCHRYDWHALDAPAYPPYLQGTSRNSIALAPHGDTKRSDLTIPPWSSWDMLKPVDHLHLHFSTLQLQQLKAECAPAAAEAGMTVSTLDALLSYVWALINRARYPDGTVEEEEEEEVYLNCTLNARHRLRQPLPDSFVGSTMFISHISAPVSTFSPSTSYSLPLAAQASAHLAPKIRSMLEIFTPHAVSDLLFSMDREVIPQRTWQAFCGKRHTLVTSWLRLGIRDVDFGYGKPAVVRAVIPEMDGCVQVMETGGEGMGWDVEVYIERGAAERLRGLVGWERGLQV